MPLNPLKIQRSHGGTSSDEFDIDRHILDAGGDAIAMHVVDQVVGTDADIAAILRAENSSGFARRPY
jgi:hypothetical protein